MTMKLVGKYPAVVTAYQSSSRTASISITGLTDGSSTSLNAEIMYPIGDKFNHTEIRVLAGDLVWVEFTNGGDPRYPLIVGYRNPLSGNAAGTRAWHHGQIELTADGTLTINAASVVINAANIEFNGNTATSGNAAVAGSLENAGQTVGNDHVHQESGGKMTSPPK